ncbi:hypothetical protein PP178_03895 [Zeaxanthinibacter sp. PT1]|uniref:hypothetical protein n=1 Tax=Zeaxanthinibacter TaxID=561554 RepID=UPI00234909C3|nr:hypothetical protein [Zeaxanthinibacter sp. PT1]MDC6350682.1 hypothetical protein [Zeaxanthinibacter sp. PT1]
MSFNLPKQKLTYAQKKKDDFAIMKETIKAYIDRADFNRKRKQDFYSFYDYYNGKMNLKDYAYVTDPYNAVAKGKTPRKFPARIRNYNIIKPVVDLLVGERAQRPFNYQAVVVGGDIKNKYEEYRTKQYRSYLEQMFVNEMNKQGVQTGLPSKELPEPEDFAKQVQTSYRDKRAIMGQQAMDYIVANVELEDKLQTAFFDWVVTGEAYSCKGVLFGDVDYQVVSPTDVFYEAGPEVKYIEDGDMAGQRKLMSVNEVVDMFHDVLTDDEIDRLENPEANTSQNFSIPFLAQNGNDNDDRHTDRLVEVYHVNFKTFTKIGFVEVPDQFGAMEVIEVSESYKPMPGEKVEWHWINETWEGYQIDGSIYKHIRPTEVQRTQINNVSKAKLMYNGARYSDRNSENVSIVEMGIPYQVLYNVFHYRLELSIAKNKDKIALMEINTVPKKHGWDEEQFMYTADALGFAFIDSTAPGQNKERVNFNQFQVLDMSLGQYIGAQFELLQAIKNEWEEFLGISRQRKGQIMASDGAGNTNMAVGQSNIMTYELFRKFSKFEEREMNGLLDVSKFAWKEGKQATYITPDYREGILDIEPSEFQEAQIGIFMKNSSKETEKLETMKQLAFSFAQNGSQPSTVAEILDLNNFAGIKEKVKEAELKQQAWEKSLKEMDQQTIQMQNEGAAQQAQAEQAFTAQESASERDSKERMHAEKIQVEWAKLGENSKPEMPDNSAEAMKLQNEREKRETDKWKTNRQIASNEKIASGKNEIEKKKIAAMKNKPASK